MSGDSFQVRDSSASYCTEADAQHAPPGYYRTQVGVIPDDWHIMPLSEVCTLHGIVRGPFGGSLRKEVFVSDGFKVYEQRNAINKSFEIGSYFVDQGKYHEMHRFSVSPGDFIVSCSGTIGRIYQIPHNAPPGIINQALLKLTTNKEVVDDRYFYTFFEWDDFQARIIESTQGGAMKNLVGMDVFRTTPVIVPPLPDQCAIAEALSDVDELLGALEMLIAKKRAIKRAAMLQLLTASTRLPGFDGEWESVCVGDLAEVLKGYGLSKSEVSSSGSRPCILYGELFTTYGTRIDRIKSRTDSDNGLVSVIGDVLMPGSTTTSGIDLATASALMLNNVALGGDVIVVRRRGERYDPRFLANYLLTVCRRQIGEMAQGITIHHLYPRQVSRLRVKLPPLKEQKGITEVLTDIDNELSALERRRDKIRTIKQGMMQQLLTGRVRLIEPGLEEAAA